MLEALGLRPIIRYRKDSTIYSYRGALVSVDRLDGLGCFCEIEVADLESDLDAIANDLGLTADRFEPRGYPTLAAQAARSGSRAAVGTRQIGG